MFEKCLYYVLSIDGDYAYLHRVSEAGDQDDAPKMVARALLPENIYEGCMLVYESLQYRMAE